LQAQINSLFIEMAMSDETGDSTGSSTSLQAQINALFVEQALASEPEPQRFPFFSMEAVFSPDEPRTQVNPFLAALLVGDVS
jgi:hypothetical protein